MGTEKFHQEMVLITNLLLIFPISKFTAKINVFLFGLGPTTGEIRLVFVQEIDPSFPAASCESHHRRRDRAQRSTGQSQGSYYGRQRTSAGDER